MSKICVEIEWDKSIYSLRAAGLEDILTDLCCSDAVTFKVREVPIERLVKIAKDVGEAALDGILLERDDDEIAELFAAIDAVGGEKKVSSE